MTSEVLITAGSVLGSLGGLELVKYLMNRKTNHRIAEAEADMVELNVVRETITFLQERLNEKEKRFAEQTDLVRKQNTQILDLTARVSRLEAERALKLCERRGCANRIPESGY